MKAYLLAVLMGAFCISFSYFLPRFLVLQLGENNPWTSYLYTYGMGSVVFVSSLLWIFTRKRNPERKRQEQLWLYVISFGFVLMLSLHALWIYLAIHVPFKD